MDDFSRRYRSVHLPVQTRVGPRVIRELADDSAHLGVRRAGVVWSTALPADLVRTVRTMLHEGGIPLCAEAEVRDGSVAESRQIGAAFLRHGADGVIAVGGGRALDVGKHLSATLSEVPVEGGGEGAVGGAVGGGMGGAAGGTGIPVVCVPTSLSNDGFASPTASLVEDSGRRVSLQCDGPTGVIVDTEICAGAPRRLLVSGLGDILAKVSALADWRMLEHAGTGQRVDGVAATIAEASISEAAAIRDFDDEGVLHLARGLLLGGIAIGVAGSSRPCSGSEHLISHALDRLRTPAGSHGIQVGLAAYVTSRLQRTGGDVMIRDVFDRLEFWSFAAEEADAGLTPELFLRSLELVPEIKPGYVTVLSRPGAADEIRSILRDDPVLAWWRAGSRT